MKSAKKSPEAEAAQADAAAAQSEPAESDQQPQSDQPPPLVEQLADLQKQLAESNDRYLRTRAELDNYRKRVQREFSEIRDNSKVGTIQEILPVFDHFQMAMHHAEQNADFQTLKQGMDMILAELNRVLENLGLKPVEAVGKLFDPNEHEAMAQVPSAEVPAGHVLQQWKVGYRLGDRLLRPATVVVSSGAEQSDDGADQQAQ